MKTIFNILYGCTCVVVFVPACLLCVLALLVAGIASEHWRRKERGYYARVARLLLLCGVIGAFAGRLDASNYYNLDITLYNDNVSTTITGFSFNQGGTQFGGSGGFPLSAGHTATFSVLVADFNLGGYMQMGSSATCVAWSSAGSFSSPDQYCSPATYSPPSEMGLPAADVYLTIHCQGNPYATPMTNTGCLSFNNTGNTVQYYWLGQSGNDASNGVPGSGVGASLNPCSTNMSAMGDRGSEPEMSGNALAVYPGDSFTICLTYPGITGNPGSFAAYAVPTDGSVQPCGLSTGQPHCVTMCGADGNPAQVNLDTIAQSVAMTQSAPTTNGLGIGNPASGVTYTNGTNGIAFSGGSTNLALNQPMEEGFAALYDVASKAYVVSVQENQNVASAGATAAINDAIRSNQLNTTVALLGAITNQLVKNGQIVITNAGSNITISLTGSNTLGTNDLISLGYWFSNALASSVTSEVSTWSNMGAGLGNGLAAMFSNATTLVSLPSNFTSSDGVTFALPNDGTSPPNIVLAVSSLPTGIQNIVSSVKAVLGWLIVIFLFFACLRYAESCLDKIMQQRQMAGNKQSAGGFNANIVTALAFAAVFISFGGTFPTLVTNFLTTGLFTSIIAPSTNIATIVNNPAFTMCTAFVPIDTIVAASVSWIAFRYFVCVGAMFKARSVILMLFT